MWSAAAVLTLAAALAAALALVRRIRRRPLALELPLALALVVASEALALGALSGLHAVTRAGVLAAHAAVLAPLAAAALARGSFAPAARGLGRRARHALAALGRPGLLLVPLGALAAASALRFAPNNWDSMTYRLARVAHWLQHRSVEPYPTHVARQVIYFPGAEYLLTVLQAVSGSDRLAPFVQLLAWALVVLAAPPLARLAGAPRALAPWGAVLVASLPMGVLQASSTQSDLLAAALALAGWTAALPFLHRRPRAVRGGDLVLVAAVLSAGLVVKATAVVAAAPLVLAGAWRLGAGVAREPRRLVPLGGALVAALAVAGLVLGPEVSRRREPAVAAALAAHGETYLYPATGALGDRAANLARGLVRHLPAPRAALVALGVDTDGACAPGAALCGRLLTRPHEDFAGNPLHVALALVAAAVLAVRRRAVPGRARAFLFAAAAAWLLFHLVFRDNAWISRLETPTFALAAVALGAAGGLSGRGLARARALAAGFALVALAVAYRVAVRNETRPPLDGPVTPYRAATYYANREPMLWPHDEALRAARRSGCRRLGLAIGEESYDYPLTWRAMQEGIEVRHVFGADPWPCLVFTDPEPPPDWAARGWQRTDRPFLFRTGAAASAASAPAP